MRVSCVAAVIGVVVLGAGRSIVAQHRDLPTSKQIVGVVSGSPQRLNSLPMSMAVSPAAEADTRALARQLRRLERRSLRARRK